MRFLPFHRPGIDEADLKAVVDCLRSGWLTTGPRTAAFERAFARFVGGRHAVGVNSCTAALHLSLLALGVGPGDEVVTTPITFVSTVNVIHHVGATPVFADVEPDRLTIDPAEVLRRITRRTRAVIPVHFAGHPCDMEAIARLARPRGIAVVGDAAHAVEARQRGRPVGALGDAVCYSFYANKNMTTGEGGMAVTADGWLASRIRTLSLHGMDRNAWRRYGPRARGHWDLVAAGFKYNMGDIQAALGLSQLKKVQEWHRRRETLTRIYDQALSEMPAVRPLKDAPGTAPARHLYVVLIERRPGRDTVMERMRARGIGVGVHFRAVHLTSFYRRSYGFKRGMFPRAEDASDRVLSLPLYPSMDRIDVERVVAALRASLRA